MKLKSVMIENFRCFESETFHFADETVVRAMNGSGKSSIAEAVVWCLYGTNIMGKKNNDSALMRHGENNMRVGTVWETNNGAEVRVERVKPETGAVKQFVNGNKAQPGEIESMFFNTVQEFLSAFIPGYFSSLEPKDAKAIIARYSDVSAEVVMSNLIEKHREALANDMFGMGYDSIQVLAKKVSNELKELSNDMLRLDGEISTYESILAESKPEQPTSLVTDKMKSQAKRYKEQIAEFETTQRNVTNQRTELTAKVQQKQQSYKAKREQKRVLSDTCPTCKQQLVGEALRVAKQEVDAFNATVDADLKQIERDGVELKERLEKLQSLEGEEALAEITRMRNFVEKVDGQLLAERDAFTRYEEWTKRFNEATTELTRLKGLREIQQANIDKQSLRMEAIKSFRSAYVRMQQQKMDALLDKVKIQLFRVNDDGEMMDNFLIQWNEKPYNLLSHSEKVWCDLEIGEAIARLRPTADIFPVWVDDAESILNLFDVRHERQVIAAYAYRSGLIVEERKVAALNLEEEARQMASLLQGRSA